MPYSLEVLRDGLDGAPLSGGPSNPDLVGWKIGEVTICNDCAGRLSGRGCGYMLRGASPIWDGVVVCALADRHRKVA